jgi:TetR/AcrR family transcriptional regulator, fatty acid metabolism regulator protein
MAPLAEGSSQRRPRPGGAPGDKRTLITEAAVEVFADKGFHQARVSDIAKKAGVADGTIYLYFKNKEDLLLSIFEEKMDELLAGLGEALAASDDPVERIRQFARFHFQQVRDHHSAAEVLQVELRLSNKFLKEYRPEKLWAYLGVFGQIVREGQARGIFRADVDPFIGMWAFFGALDELAMQWVLTRRADRSEGTLRPPGSPQRSEGTLRAAAHRSEGGLRPGINERPGGSPAPLPPERGPSEAPRERFSLEAAADQVAEVFIRGLLVDGARPVSGGSQ